MSATDPDVISKLTAGGKDDSRNHTYVVRERSAIQPQRIDLFRQLDPQDVSSCGSRDFRAFRKVSRDRLAEELHLIGKRRPQPSQMPVVAALLNKFRNRDL